MLPDLVWSMPSRGLEACGSALLRHWTTDEEAAEKLKFRVFFRGARVSTSYLSDFDYTKSALVHFETVW